MIKKYFLLSAWSVLLLKIFLAGLAFTYILRTDQRLFWVFGLFILLDLLDGRVIRDAGYRLWDTVGDRFFTYACFVAFLFSPIQQYPLILFILAFLLRDLLVVVFAFKKRIKALKSNLSDRLVLLTSAIFFLLATTEKINFSHRWAMIGGIILPVGVLMYGILKVGRNLKK